MSPFADRQPSEPAALGVLAQLYALAPKGAVLGLERMRDACASFGHPERQFEAIHVAGTNGKGSVAAMLASMARANGQRVGLYTSPHLCEFRERIQVDGAPARDDVLLPALHDVLTRCPELTFFEASTLAAFLVFARGKVELAVIEVGLGGRLDATNVLEQPRATAITRIALDHTDRLGTTYAAIASEKAGIIKRGVPLVIGALEPSAEAVIRERAGQFGATVHAVHDHADLDAFVARHPPALVGRHQRGNASVAVSLARLAKIDDRAIARGLREVRWPGRCEVLATSAGTVLLDAAHNADGAEALAQALADRGTPPEHVALVFGAMADKDYPAMLLTLAPYARHRVYVAPEGRRAAEPAALAAIVPGTLASSSSEALALGRQAVGARGLVVVAGSIFLVGAARAELLQLRRDPVIAL